MELKRDESYYLDKLLAHAITNPYMEFGVSIWDN